MTRMARYEYTCPACGDFEVARPIGTAADAEPCPACGRRSPRRFSAPALTSPRSPLRQAHEAAERSAHEPVVTNLPRP